MASLALMRRASSVLMLLLAVGSAVPALAQSSLRERRALDAVIDNLRLNHCSSAVQRLNDGIAAQYSSVYLLAGTMYEQGLCVKRDWDRAVYFYAIAHDAGNQDAAYRLAAGYAAPQTGPDVAAALWWLKRAGVDHTPAMCRVAAADATDPDRFVQALKTWPAARLASCNYIAGVVGAVLGDVRYPASAQRENITGEVILRFTPAANIIAVETRATDTMRLGGVLDGEDTGLIGGRTLFAAFEEQLRDDSKRALARYPQPAGIDPNLYLDLRISFTMHAVL